MQNNKPYSSTRRLNVYKKVICNLITEILRLPQPENSKSTGHSKALVIRVL